MVTITAHRLFTASCVCLILLSGCRPRPDHADEPVPPPPAEAATESGLRVITDPETVFRRAFWMHPSGDDTILSAELREWANPASGDILSWQWFIHVHPGAALQKTLQPGGRFELISVSSAEISGPTPAWFIPRETRILKSAQGSLTVWIRPEDGSLFAHDLGGGFAMPVSP